MVDEVRIAPRLLPRDLVDFCVVAFVASPVLIGALFVFPALLGFVFHEPAVVLIAAGAICVIYFSFSVRHLTLSQGGIRFHRLVGTPKFLPWSEMVSVSEAPRWELILHGWFWPLLPAREMTASFTSVGHYRIQWGSAHCYFPPADVRLFQNYVHERAPELVAPTGRSKRTSTGGIAAGRLWKVNLPHWLTRRSLLICTGNYAIVALTVLALQSDYFKSDTPLLVRVLFYPFAMFTTFAFLPALAGVIIGFEELRSKATKFASAVAILGNLALMVAYIIAVKILWPVLMSV